MVRTIAGEDVVFVRVEFDRVRGVVQLPNSAHVCLAQPGCHAEATLRVLPAATRDHLPRRVSKSGQILIGLSAQYNVCTRLGKCRVRCY